jgi:hypothetical protein
LVKFYSAAEAIKYLRDAVEGYQKESEMYGDRLGLIIRTAPAPASPPREEKKQDKGDKKTDQKSRPVLGAWVKMGSLLLSPTNPGQATAEVMYSILEDLKSKLARTSEALKSFELNQNTLIPSNGTFQIYMRNGVPERVIIEGEGVKGSLFRFDGHYRIV